MECDTVGEVLNAVNKQSAMEINILTQEESRNTNKREKWSIWVYS